MSHAVFPHFSPLLWPSSPQPGNSYSLPTTCSNGTFTQGRLANCPWCFLCVPSAPGLWNAAGWAANIVCMLTLWAQSGALLCWMKDPFTLFTHTWLHFFPGEGPWSVDRTPGGRSGTCGCGLHESWASPVAPEPALLSRLITLLSDNFLNEPCGNEPTLQVWVQIPIPSLPCLNNSLTPLSLLPYL